MLMIEKKKSIWHDVAFIVVIYLLAISCGVWISVMIDQAVHRSCQEISIRDYARKSSAVPPKCAQLWGDGKL